MARLIPLLVLLALFALLVFLRQAGRPRSDRVYRPRAHPFGRRPMAESDTNWVVPAADLAGLRDAYSSATLDPMRPLVRCGGCQAWYQDSSVVALRRENAGRCALCGSDDLRDVRIV